MFPLLRSRMNLPIPTISSYTYFPAFFGKSKKFVQNFNEDLDYVFPLSLLYYDTASKEQISEITATLKNYYFKDKSIGVETIRELIKVWYLFLAHLSLPIPYN